MTVVAVETMIPPFVIRSDFEAARTVCFVWGLCGLTEPLLWIQLVAERSALRWRALAVITLRARRFTKSKGKVQLNQRRKSVSSKDKTSTIKGERQYI